MGQAATKQYVVDIFNRMNHILELSNINILPTLSSHRSYCSFSALKNGWKRVLINSLFSVLAGRLDGAGCYQAVCC